MIRAASLAAVLLGLMLLAGCGSGDDTTTQGGAAGQGAAVDSGESREEAQRRNEAAAGRKSERRDRNGERKGGDGKKQGQGSDRAKDPPEGSNQTRRERVERELEKECPPNLGEDSCAALVEGFVISRGESKGQVVSEPEDCTRVRSREECEATLRAQKAAEGTDAVDVEECFENPTPRCEEVLRVVLEQQRAAAEAGG